MRKPSGIPETRALIVETIFNQGPISRFDLVTKHLFMPEHRNAFRKAMKQLRAEGLISTQGTGYGLRYFLTLPNQETA